MKKVFGGGIVAGVLAALLFMGGMVSAGAFGGDDADYPAGAPEGEAAAAAIGPRLSESNYVQVTPCRVFDTRAVAAGAFASETRHFDARGNLSAQGGKPGSCAIPAHANSIVITITGVTPTGKGFMRGKAYDGSNALPQATQLNYAPAIDASNTLTLPISQGLSKEFTLGTFGNRVHLVGDVLGYFADAQYAAVNAVTADSPFFVSQKRFLSVEQDALGGSHYLLTAQGDVRGCAVIGQAGTSDDARDGTHNGVVHVEEVNLVSGNTEILLRLSDGDTDLDLNRLFTVLVQC